MNAKRYIPPIAPLVIIVSIFALLLSACAQGAVVPSAQVIQMCSIGAPQKVTDASGTTWDCASVRSAFPAAPTSVATNAAAPTTVAQTGKCDPLAVTSLPVRPDAVVNGTKVTLQVRDLNDGCERPLFYNETGVGKGANYAFDMPLGWTVITASASAEVQREGNTAKQFLGCPIVVVEGPFKGGIGLYEGALRVVPKEWADNLLKDEVVPIQSAQCKKTVVPTVFK